jgi:hypothetical protein
VAEKRVPALTLRGLAASGTLTSPPETVGSVFRKFFSPQMIGDLLALLKEEHVMNANHMRWLLQTIEDPEIAKRFVEAQYKRVRISYDLMIDISQELDNVNWIADDGLTLTCQIQTSQPSVDHSH